MKWFHSLITKISLIFLLAIIGILALFFNFFSHQRDKEFGNIEEIARYALRANYDPKNESFDLQSLQNEGFVLVKDTDLQRKILANGPYGLMQNRQVAGHNMQNMMRLRTRAVAFEGKIYIRVRTNSDTILLFETPYKKELLRFLFAPLLSILLVILLYIAIIRSILPLYDLRKKVKAFANGDYDIECASKQRDEIGILANEFDASVKKIKKLRDSRQLFLRNIMHEFKTPITKGKIISELLDNVSHQESLQNLFRRQESLIEDFSRIEKLSADELPLDKSDYNLQDIVDFALDILNHKEDQVSVDLIPMNLHVDFDLFATALKNLLDNGINYAKDHKVQLRASERVIEIVNTGKALEFPLERYSEPYFLGGSKQKSSRGLGFGLFITWHIIRLHKMQLSYKRNGEENIFTISL